jgi:hypothetical protein
MTVGSFFKAQSLAGVALVGLACASPVLAQTPSSPASDMARCSQLYSTYNHYSGNASYSRAADIETAMAECQKGNYASGIADLTAAMNRAAIPLPPAETATAK